MTDSYDYDNVRRLDRTYISKRFKDREGRPMRIASIAVAPNEDFYEAVEKDRLIIRITSGARQYIKATFYEDTRGIQTLTFRRYTTATGAPHEVYFSFNPPEIDRIIEFLLSIRKLHITTPSSLILPDEQLREALLSSDQVVDYLYKHPDLAAQILQNQITSEDVVALGYRRAQLERFRVLLCDPDAFAAERARLGGRSDEAVWQAFFEANQWIFGYGLQYVFATSFDSERLERSIQGFDIGHRGKRADAVMKTRGLLSSLCLVEIKKPTTPLLADRPYRPGAWAPSSELSGGTIQLQSTVRIAIDLHHQKIEPKDDEGNPTGETIFNHQPRSFLVIGSLDQFISKNGRVNEEQLRSFELNRANTVQPQIITFDELYERAKFIVELPDRRKLAD